MAPAFLSLLGLCVLTPWTFALPAANNNEIYYLVNCSKCAITDSNCRYYRSLMAYYLIQSKSENGELPTATSEAPGLLNWEGNTILGTFSAANDPDFSATIDKDALNSQFYNTVGTGKTETHNFTCYKDSDRILYRNGSDYCYSIYWCQWVGQS
ncbi:hypothetical protein N431DRAFT_495744 [Stipitochalara longipes BDJ]|nr:hypothetical protein N431DRAFT_495744 [Stipitochalara longipes BDJ]